LNVVWDRRICLQKNFHHLLEPQVLVAFSHRRPDVLVYCAESEIDKSLVVENASLRLEFTARSITIVHKGADGLSLGPRFFVEFSVEVYTTRHARHFVNR